MGAEGSGNFNHAGRPGERGGSTAGDGSLSLRVSSNWRTDRALANRAQKPNGGFSVAANGSAPRDGYMVAPSKSTEKIYDASKFTRADIAAYRRDHATELKQKGAHLGAWNNGKSKIYLDVTHQYATEAEAHMIARKADQLAIYDVKAGKSIDTKQVATVKMSTGHIRVRSKR